MSSNTVSQRNEAPNLIDFDDPLQHEHVQDDDDNQEGVVQLNDNNMGDLPVDLFSAPSPVPSIPSSSQPQPAGSSSLSSNEALKSLYAMGPPTMATPLSFSQPITPALHTPITPNINTPIAQNAFGNTISPMPSQAQQPQTQQLSIQQTQNNNNNNNNNNNKSPFDDLVDLMK